MDRDSRWERTQRAYDLLVAGARRHRAASGVEAVRAAYERGETDEFIEPTLVGEEARIRPGDRVFCFNFRPDRMRQLVARARRARLRRGRPRLDGRRRVAARYATMTEYEEGWPYPVAFRPSARRRRSRA